MPAQPAIPERLDKVRQAFPLNPDVQGAIVVPTADKGKVAKC
jgi:hypothetical protein